MLRLLGVLGVGALAMYFFDPVSGRQRRTQARSQFDRYQRELTHYAEGTAKELRNRAEGLASEARGMVERRLGQRRPASAVDIDLSQQQ